MFARRDLYLDKLKDKVFNGLIKIIVGPRRVGKSFLLFKIFYDYLKETGTKEENIICLALDDPKNFQYHDSDLLYEFITSKIVNKDEKYFLLLDEAQFAINESEVKHKLPIKLYGILNSLLNLGNVDVYVTGSNSRFLSSDIQTEFRGRGDVIDVFPLSFKEFYSAQEKTIDKFEAWREYVLYGGMPQLLTLKKPEDKASYLKSLFTNIYVKDITERYHLKGDVILDDLISVLASDIGSLTNPTKITNTFNSNGIKTTNKTIQTYIEYLTDSFLIQKAKRFDVKGRKYINSTSKYYFTDIGLRNSRLNFRQTEITHILENIIYNELLILGLNVDVGAIEYRGTEKQKQLEIDFVCTRGNDKYYIQSAFTLTDPNKRNQEILPFQLVKDSFKKIIITSDFQLPFKDEFGYLQINIIDFLLNPEIIL